MLNWRKRSHRLMPYSPGRAVRGQVFEHRLFSNVIIVPGLSQRPSQAALPSAMRRAVDAFTSKTSNVAGDSKSGLNVSLIE